MRADQNIQDLQDNNSDLGTNGKKRKKSGEGLPSPKYVNKNTLEEAQKKDKDSMKVTQYLSEQVKKRKAKEYLKTDESKKDLDTNTQEASNEQTLEEFLNEKIDQGYAYTNYSLSEFYRRDDEVTTRTYPFAQWLHFQARSGLVYKDNGLPVGENVDIGRIGRTTIKVDMVNNREICTFKSWQEQHYAKSQQDKPADKPKKARTKKDMSKKDRATIYIDKDTLGRTDSSNSNAISVADYLTAYVLNQAVDVNGKPVNISNEGSGATDAISFQKFLELKAEAGDIYADSNADKFLNRQDVPEKTKSTSTTVRIGNTTYYKLNRIVNLRMRQQYVYKGGVNDGLPVPPDKVDKVANKVTYKGWYESVKSSALTSETAVTSSTTTTTRSTPSSTTTTNTSTSSLGLFGRSTNFDDHTNTSASQPDPEKINKMGFNFLLN